MGLLANPAAPARLSVLFPCCVPLHSRSLCAGTDRFIGSNGVPHLSMTFFPFCSVAGRLFFGRPPCFPRFPCGFDSLFFPLRAICVSTFPLPWCSCCLGALLFARSIRLNDSLSSVLPTSPAFVLASFLPASFFPPFFFCVAFPQEGALTPPPPLQSLSLPFHSPLFFCWPPMIGCAWLPLSTFHVPRLFLTAYFSQTPSSFPYPARFLLPLSHQLPPYPTTHVFPQCNLLSPTSLLPLIFFVCGSSLTYFGDVRRLFPLRRPLPGRRRCYEFRLLPCSILHLS